MHQIVPAGVPVVLASFLEPKVVHVVFDGGGGSSALDVFADGTKKAELAIAGQSVLLQARETSVIAHGGVAVVTVRVQGVDEMAPPSPAPLPPAPPPAAPPPTAATPCTASARILNRTSTVSAAGRKPLDIRGVVTIAPADYLPGTATLAVEVFDRHNAASGSSRKTTIEVRHLREEIACQTGIIRPRDRIEVHLVVIASDGTTSSDGHSINATR